MVPDDTSAAAHERQIEFYRRLSPGARVQLAWKMSEDAQRVSQDGIRSRHPHYSPAEVRFAFLRHWVGDDLFRKAWPLAPLLDP